MTDPYLLRRSTDAQDHDGTYARALAELRAGRKTSHWMWFVFPQIEGLGHSPTAERYAIASLAEGEAYLAHPVLGPRLLEATQAVAELDGPTATELLGATDAMKLRSSMTLFEQAAPQVGLFADVLERLFDGRRDAATEQRLGVGR